MIFFWPLDKMGEGVIDSYKIWYDTKLGGPEILQKSTTPKLFLMTGLPTSTNDAIALSIGEVCTYHRPLLYFSPPLLLTFALA